MSVLDSGLGKMAPEYDRLARVNDYFEEFDGLVSVHDSRLPNGWYSSGKALEAELAIGVINHLDLDSFIAHLRLIEWAIRSAVQLVVREDEDEVFRIINVFPRAEFERINHFWER